MVAQQMAQDRPSIFRRLILVGTAPRGEDIMHLEKPSLAKPLGDPKLQGYTVLQKIFFAPTQASQAAGAAFIERLLQGKEDREPASGPEIARAQITAFREWDRFSGERFADLKNIRQPALVVNGIHDEMIPVRNSYWLSASLPNAVLLTYPDSGHGSLFQFHESFTRQAAAFLASNSVAAPLGQRQRPHSRYLNRENARTLRAILQRLGNAGSHRTAWWSTQSRSDQSPTPNSLLTGKRTGNFAESGLPMRFSSLIHERIQELAEKFLTQRNREFFEGIRENFRGNREFSRQNSESDPGPIF